MSDDWQIIPGGRHGPSFRELMFCHGCGENVPKRAPHGPEDCRRVWEGRVHELDRAQTKAWRELGRIRASVQTCLDFGLGDSRTWLEGIGKRLEAVAELLDPRSPEELQQLEAYYARRAARSKLEHHWYVRARESQPFHVVEGDAEGPKWDTSLCGTRASRSEASFEVVPVTATGTDRRCKTCERLRTDPYRRNLW